MSNKKRRHHRRHSLQISLYRGLQTSNNNHIGVTRRMQRYTVYMMYFQGFFRKKGKKIKKIISLFRHAIINSKQSHFLKTIRYIILSIPAYLEKNGNKNVLRLVRTMNQRQAFLGLKDMRTSEKSISFSDFLLLFHIFCRKNPIALGEI